MTLRTSWLALVVLALSAGGGCTKTVYYAVMAPPQAMDDHNSCYGQCQMHHAGRTKEVLLCLDNCPDSQVVREKQCSEVSYDTKRYACTTMQNHAFDGVSFGLGIGFLVLLTVLLAVFAARAETPTNTQ